MANIKLHNSNGEEISYLNVSSLTVPNLTGGTELFTLNGSSGSYDAGTGITIEDDIISIDTEGAEQGQALIKSEDGVEWGVIEGANPSIIESDDLKLSDLSAIAVGYEDEPIESEVTLVDVQLSDSSFSVDEVALKRGKSYTITIGNETYYNCIPIDENDDRYNSRYIDIYIGEGTDMNIFTSVGSNGIDGYIDNVDDGTPVTITTIERVVPVHEIPLRFLPPLISKEDVGIEVPPLNEDKIIPSQYLKVITYKEVVR